MFSMLYFYHVSEIIKPTIKPVQSCKFQTKTFIHRGARSWSSTAVCVNFTSEPNSEYKFTTPGKVDFHF